MSLFPITVGRGHKEKIWQWNKLAAHIPLLFIASCRSDLKDVEFAVVCDHHRLLTRLFPHVIAVILMRLARVNQTRVNQLSKLTENSHIPDLLRSIGKTQNEIPSKPGSTRAYAWFPVSPLSKCSTPAGYLEICLRASWWDLMGNLCMFWKSLSSACLYLKILTRRHAAFRETTRLFGLFTWWLLRFTKYLLFWWPTLWNIGSN